MAKFIIDQQLPHALAAHLMKLGHDATHIKDYPGGATLADAEVIRIADDDGRIVVTKDDDFRVAHLLQRAPSRLLHVTCGNISTADLLALFDRHYSELTVQTEAAGLVAVAKPFSEDGVDVLSVIAAPEVPPSQVWKAVDEVAALLSDGALWRAEMPDDALPEGHSWHARSETTVMFSSEVAKLPMGPNGRRQPWRTWLRPWSASSIVDLESAPGVGEVSRALLPEYDNPDIGCKQTVRAEYDEDGFRAAAVTAMLEAGSAPEFVEVEVDHVEVDMAGPHAVVAIARGGAWEGVPLVSAWVSGGGRRSQPDTDWESLALLADLEAEEAAELRALKEARMRERGEWPPR